jgi:hypothetical protein
MYIYIYIIYIYVYIYIYILYIYIYICIYIYMLLSTLRFNSYHFKQMASTTYCTSGQTAGFLYAHEMNKKSRLGLSRSRLSCPGCRVPVFLSRLPYPPAVLSGCPALAVPAVDNALCRNRTMSILVSYFFTCMPVRIHFHVHVNVYARAHVHVCGHHSLRNSCPRPVSVPLFIY